MSQQILRKKPSKGSTASKIIATKHNTADLSAAVNGQIQGLHIYLRSSGGRIKIRTNYNTGLDDREYENRDLTIADVATLYSQLNKLFQSLEQGGDSENLRKAIAQEGWYLFDKLIPQEDKLRIAELHSQYLTEAATLEDGAFLRPYHILVKANGVTIPWELLYIENPWDSEKNEPVYDERYFLGYWSLIKQDITPSSRNDPQLRHFGEYGVKVFFDHNLDVARDDEGPGVEVMFRNAGFEAHLAHELASDDRSDAFFAELSRKSGCIVHMACHSSNPKDDQSQAFICVNRDYVLTETEVRRNQRPIDGEPLLFLNSCEMALVRPDSYCQFLNYFFERGFSAIIATEIEITDTAAWDFAKRVYTVFLQAENSTFDVAIFDARRAFLRDFDSLIGFTYSYYGLGNLIRSMIGER